MANVSIGIRDNGPYRVRGASVITDADGRRHESPDVLALCRCGQSAEKPLCDGTHKTTGFESRPRATGETNA